MPDLTMKELDRHAARISGGAEKTVSAPRDRSKLNAERRTGVPRDFRTSLSNNKHDAALKSDLPAEPCWRCQARGWCEHRSAEV